jgi:hypothetical protein
LEKIPPQLDRQTKHRSLQISFVKIFQGIGKNRCNFWSYQESIPIMGKRNATYEQNEAETLKDTVAVKISMSSLWAHIQGSIDSDDSPKNKTRGT